MMERLVSEYRAALEFRNQRAMEATAEMQASREPGTLGGRR
jgi:hypothetical protein